MVICPVKAANYRRVVFTDLIKTKLDEQRNQILAEFSSERAAHQKMVKEFARLEQRYTNLEDELRFEQSSPDKIASQKRKAIAAGIDMFYSLALNDIKC